MVMLTNDLTTLFKKYFPWSHLQTIFTFSNSLNKWCIWNI